MHMGGGGQSLWGIGLKQGKDAECEEDDEDGMLWGEKKHLQYTHSGTGLVCFT